ncbi:putative sugar nucleotidyl transferase [Novipirellula artificiosorum]|uniref:Bifunctional protein GlmU n=1 Tax=Novipirellula artificiosorum TaxID=2528016 RepID=A0A5C6DLY6_9BACT|nr:putative sugar nucleotidyl transferase [Novipirellula artificiosorum]TWU37154.1 Bifunctional protein GlmU [Novipirellula artificiosorum]
MQIICFEDQLASHLFPITQSRPAYAVTCASLRLVDRLKELIRGPLAGSSLLGSVRSYLTEIQQLDFELSQAATEIGDKWPTDDGGILLVNARLVPRVALDAVLVKMAQEDRSVSMVDEHDGSILIARLTAADLAARRSELSPPPDPVPEKSSRSRSKSVVAPLLSLTDRLVQLADSLPRSPTTAAAFHWPHDIVSWHMNEMRESIEWRVAHGEYRQHADGVFVNEGVSLGEYLSINVENGPILLERNVKVGPFCYLEGPLHAGAGTRVIEHSALKDGVSLGHTVKIGGEVEASVIEPYTNKQHHGFLGHSYLGSWINLGAGTCNSDLKNTYGKINMEYDNTKIATGMQFLGCFIGDYSKSAINTSIFTGKVIGVCSMLYGFVTSNVPSFVNYARLFGQTALLPADVMISTQAKMFARRKVQQRECDKQLILDMYEQSATEREAAEHYML